jgi:hypothetical protein
MTVRAGQGIVRAGQGKKTSSEQDKTRNHFQSRTRYEMTIRAGQGKKLSPDARRESKARSTVDVVLLLFELYNPAFTLHLSYVSSSLLSR